MDNPPAPWSIWAKGGVVAACVGGVILLGYLDELINGKPEARKTQRKQNAPRSKAEAEAMLLDHISQATNGQVTNVNEYVTGLIQGARAAQEVGNFDKAIEEYQKGLTLTEMMGDENGMWLFMTFMASALKDKRDFDGADKLLKKVLVSITQAINSGQNVEAAMEQYNEVLILLSDLYFLMGKYEESGKLLQGIITQHEEKEAAINTLPSAALEDPRIVPEIRKLQQSLALFYQTLSRIHAKTGEIPEALESSKKAIMKVLALPDGSYLLNTFFSPYIKLMQDNGSTKDEINDEFESIVSEANVPDQFNIVLLQILFANFNSEKDDYASAELWLQKAFELAERKSDPKSKKLVPSILNALASTLRENGKHEEAAQIMAKLKQKLSIDSMKLEKPPLTNSKFLRTKEAVVDIKEGPRFSLLHEIKNLQLGSVLETTFPTLPTEKKEVVKEEKEVEEAQEGQEEAVNDEQKEDEVKVIQVNHTVEEGKQNIDIQSPIYESIPAGLHEVVTKIFSDETKTTQLSQHHVLVRHGGGNSSPSESEIAALFLNRLHPESIDEDYVNGEEETPFEDDHDFQD